MKYLGRQKLYFSEARSAADKAMKSKLTPLIKTARDDKETAYFCL